MTPLPQWHVDRLLLVPTDLRMLVIGEGRGHKRLPPLYPRNFECLFVDVDPKTEPDVCIDVLDLSIPRDLSFCLFGHVCLMSPPDRLYSSEKFLPMLARVCVPDAFIWDPYTLSPLYKTVATDAFFQQLFVWFLPTQHRVILRPDMRTYMSGSVPYSEIHGRFWITDDKAQGTKKEIDELIYGSQYIANEELRLRHRNDAKKLCEPRKWVWKRTRKICPWNLSRALASPISTWRWFQHGKFYAMKYCTQPGGFFQGSRALEECSYFDTTA